MSEELKRDIQYLKRLRNSLEADIDILRKRVKRINEVIESLETRLEEEEPEEEFEEEFEEESEE
jgi:prefoldin subunit 5